MANEFIARKGLIVLSNGATITGSLNANGKINAVGFDVSASIMSASVYYGDGSQLTGVTATGLDIDNFGADLTAITVVGTDKLPLSDNGTEGRINVSQLSTPLAGTGLEANGGTIRIAAAAAGDGLSGGAGTALSVNTGSAHFVTGSRKTISSANTAGAAGINLTYNADTGVVSGSLVNSSITVNGQSVSLGGSTTVTANTTNALTLGNGLTGTSFNGSTAVTTTVDTGSAHFITGSTKILDIRGVYSSSAQIANLGFATTASNSFTGIQNIDNTTQSTTWTDGALVVDGGVGIAKNLNVSGSVNIQGLLTVVSMSTQYVTSSQYVIANNKIILNDDDIARFAGISIFDSGSSSATASIYWDSINHKFIYENISGEPYNSAMLIAGPKNIGTLGNEVGLTDFRVPVAHGSDHIDSRPTSSSIRVDFPTRLTHIEAGLQVTGSISSSVGFAGDGSQLTGIATTLTISGSTSGNGTVALRTQPLIVSGTNGLTSTVNGQTVTISGSDATTTSKGVASFNSTNFTVTNGAVTSNNISINGTNVTLGGTRNITLQEITTQGATTTTQTTFSGGAIVGGVLNSGSSNTSAAGTSVIVTQFATGSYDAAHFDYVIKDGTNFRTGTVMSVWRAGTANVEYTDTSTNDIGNTTQAIFDVDTSSGNVRLKLTAVSGTWTVKTAVRVF